MAAWVHAIQSPGAIGFTEYELWRIDRARAAVIINTPPHIIDEMPIQDVYDVLFMNSSLKELESWATRQGTKRPRKH